MGSSSTSAKTLALSRRISSEYASGNSAPRKGINSTAANSVRAIDLECVNINASVIDKPMADRPYRTSIEPVIDPVADILRQPHATSLEGLPTDAEIHGLGRCHRQF